MGRKWTEEQKKQMSETQRWVHERDNRRPVFVAPKPTSGVSVNCSVRIDLDELSPLSPAQVSAVMNGIAEVLAANNKRPAQD